jgi:hypothetical protein
MAAIFDASVQLEGRRSLKEAKEKGGAADLLPGVVYDTSPIEELPVPPNAGSPSSPPDSPPLVGGSPMTMASDSTNHSGKPRAASEEEVVATKIQALYRRLSSKKMVDKLKEEEPQVSTKDFYKYIKKEIDDEDACLGLFFTLVLIVSFILFAEGFLRIQVSFAIGDAIINDLEENANFAFVGPMGNKVFRDVHTVADFWSWVRLGALPIMIQPTWQYGEQYPYAGDTHDFVLGASATREEEDAADRLNIYPQPSDDFDPYVAPKEGNQYLLFNRVLGGVRLTQERAKSVKCLGPPGSWLGDKPCFNARTGANYDIPPDHQFLPLVTTDRVEWLDHTKEYDMLFDQLTDMEDGCQLATAKQVRSRNQTECLCTSCYDEKGQVGPWVDDGTMAVDLAIYVFNPTYGIYSRVNVFFIFSRGGRVWKRINVQAVSSLDAYPVDSYVAAGVWLGCVAWVALSELNQIRKVVWKYGLKGFFTDYLAPTEVVDWLAIINGVFIMLTWVRLVFFEIREVDSAGEVFVSDIDQRDMLIEKLDIAMATAEKFRLGLGVYAVVIILRLFKSFDSNPRLAQVTRTLEACIVDLLHFLVVFVAIFYMYAVAGVIFFGHRMAEFVTVDRGIRTCYIILLGELDWEELVRSGGRVIAMTWFITFTTVVVFIMLNMLLAIVFGTYDEVRGNLGSGAETLWSQTTEIARRWKDRRTGKAIGLRDIIEGLHHWAGAQQRKRGSVYFEEVEQLRASGVLKEGEDKRPETLLEEDTRRLTAGKLVTWVPGMKVPQASTLINEVLGELDVDDDSKTTADVLTALSNAKDSFAKRLERIEAKCDGLSGRFTNANGK